MADKYIVGTYKPSAVDVVIRIDREELGSLGFRDFPKDSTELADAIHNIINGNTDRLPDKCEKCGCFRWNDEYEYYYCAKDASRARLPIRRPPWCPKMK